MRPKAVFVKGIGRYMELAKNRDCRYFISEGFPVEESGGMFFRHYGALYEKQLRGTHVRRAGRGYPSGRIGVWNVGERATPKGFRMIKLTRINNAPIVINSDLIEYIEAIPDTMITLTTGQKIMVLEGVDDVIERVKDYRRSLLVKPFLD